MSKNKFLSPSGEVVFCCADPTPDYWDSHWESVDFERAHNAPRNRLVSQVSRKYLGADAAILEGGCGPSITVGALSNDGYRACGLDFAQRTLHLAKQANKDLNLVAGDVFALPFPDATFDGYWSLGVIEHFYDGYQAILSEACRVLKPGGVLFLTFPQMSPLRRVIACVGGYQSLPVDFSPTEDRFYQFALRWERVQSDLSLSRFRVVERTGFDAVKGLKDEVAICSNKFGKLYAAQGRRARATRFLINSLLGQFAGHMQLMVAQKL